MREIDFRAFDKKYKAMFSCLTGLFFDENVCAAQFLSTLGDEKIVNINDIELMQYTGLKDKTDKKIYEGDIVKLHDGRIGKIIFSRCMFKFSDDYITTPLNECTCFAKPNLEVIGNIYENLRLFKEDKSINICQ